MIRAIDNKVLAFYQWLVNVSGKKPMWWGEQCCGLMLVGVILGAFRDDFPAPKWVQLCLGAFMVVMVALIWASTRNEALWSMERNDSNLLWRMLFIVLLADDIWRVFQGTAKPDTVSIAVGFLSYHYFLLCQPPPPPKPRTRTTLAGNH